MDVHDQLTWSKEAFSALGNNRWGPETNINSAPYTRAITSRILCDIIISNGETFILGSSDDDDDDAALSEERKKRKSSKQSKA